MVYGISLKQGVLLASAVSALPVCGSISRIADQAPKRPNILFAISDDQSYPYASAYGVRGIRTPAFDRVASSGILFNNAFVAAPQSSPSRAAILTGKNIWQLEEAGTHSSYFPKKFIVFTDLLESNGYKTGYTGKPWSPGNWEGAGWTRNPVGPDYNKKKVDEVPAKGIGKNDYSGNFIEFYNEKSADQPFFFWYGATEPHREYEDGSGLRSGKTLEDAVVPSFLPDDKIIKSDILDYLLEIEYFDLHLMKIIKFLEEKGELDNTLIVVTADNGMSFPAAKANLMEFGTHVPLAISWPERIISSRISNDLVSLIDLAPTFLEVAGLKKAPAMTGRSLSGILFSSKSGVIDPARNFVLTGRERHSHARPDNLGYPARAIRTAEFLYIMNLKPERWPAGDPASPESPIWPGFHDIDNGPSKTLILKNASGFPEYFEMGYARRGPEQLYDIRSDPGCTKNLAADKEYSSVIKNLRSKLTRELKAQKDPRFAGKGDIFDSYPRFGAMREFEGFREQGKYNPAYQKLK